MCRRRQGSLRVPSAAGVSGVDTAAKRDAGGGPHTLVRGGEMASREPGTRVNGTILAARSGESTALYSSRLASLPTGQACWNLW